MKYKDYSSDVWATINNTLDQVSRQQDQPIAAFDADGTLWDIDLGETFFHYQIDRKLVALPASPFEHYENMKAQDPRKAYLWLAQICQGKSLAEVQDWAKAAVKAAAPIPVFNEQKKLIQLLLSKGVKVYVITASVKWAVEGGADLVGLSHDNIIGVETEVQDGIITDKQKGVITYRQGKVEALLQKTGGKLPFLASGNTMGDFNLLESATHLRLAISAASRDDKIFKTEKELADHADQNGWLHHRFI
ncbi:haloacid dehalogenase-like hydrolase [Bdellovibrio sp. SKB1291214]|uniref:HAD family hydrolase n=1 Tax=Bdellovibrio sp. SKB1291214 TaxID=1732569 RepID=UPI000B518E9B|nr:haloacid dehalogenase-like hydrolase [Bdellovibrio sp. SKB1291214]UYL10389.1 haloacid dehalogenase-like hydrolase [Bdellovibrio sp. SKB1291214]